MHNPTNIWSEVSGWPPEQRLALAQLLMQSLQQEGPAVRKERQEALQQLIGIWKTDRPLSDEQVEHVLEHDMMKKYG